jgi:hypothetical protein
MVHLKPYSGDPFGILIIDHLHLSPVSAALIVLFVMLILDAISFRLMGRRLLALFGWTSEWAYGIYSYVVTPLVAAAYVWVSQASGRMFLQLRDSDALIAPPGRYDSFLRLLERVYTHPGWAIAALIVVIVLAIFYIFLFRSTAEWPRRALILRIVKVLLLYVPGWYMVCQIVARQAVTIWGLWQLFDRFEVYPHPLHPDRAGGLSAINDYAVGFTYIIVLVGIGVAVQVYVTWKEHGSALTRDIAGLLAAYVVIGLVFFFLPSWAAHNAMKTAKQELLMDISQRFQADYAEVVEGLEADTVGLEESITRLESLRTLYELTEQFPVWPLDTGTLSRFAATIVFPLIPVGAEMAVDFVRTAIESRGKEKPES